MKRILAPLCLLAALARPGFAEDAPVAAPEGNVEEGFSLLEEGARLILRGILDEMGPTIEDMQGSMEEAARKLGPALSQLMALVDDLHNYEAPERLPNGDVILRRKPGAPPPPPLPKPEAAPVEPGAEIEL